MLGMARSLQFLDVAVAVRVDEIDDCIHVWHDSNSDIRVRSSITASPDHPILTFHRQIFSVPPLLPRPGVVAHARIPEKTQREIGVRGAFKPAAERASMYQQVGVYTPTRKCVDVLLRGWLSRRARLSRVASSRVSARAQLHRVVEGVGGQRKSAGGKVGSGDRVIG